MTTPTLPTSLADNFLPLRHLAAWMVIYGHSYSLAANPHKAMDVVQTWLPGYSASRCAVYLFFAISGYLLTLSLLRRPSVLRYAWHRALRIYPAYAVCLLACVLAFGPVFTVIPLSEYFTSAETWEHLRHNAIPTSFVWTLPGVFENNPYPAIVNGSLWSLGLEIRWYFWLGLLAALGLVRRRTWFTVLVVAFLAFGIGEAQIGKPDPLGYRALTQTFLLGALAAQWRERLQPTHAWLLAAIALLWLGVWSQRLDLALPPAATALVLWASYRLPALRWFGQRDYSYGIFLYGFPVQQAVMVMWADLSPLALCVVSSLMVLPFAIVSWHLIEQPVLRLKSLSVPADWLGRSR